MRPTAISLSASLLLCLTLASPLLAQAPSPAPHQVWTGAASGGVALTSGNSDTSTVNVGYNLTYDPLTKNVVKSDGLFLRGKNAGLLATNRLGLNVRDQYTINGRTYVFGQNQYLRDTFKNIDYLDAPTGGIGYKVIGTPATQLDADGGLGVVWEKNPGLDVRTSGAVTASEKLTHTLTSTTTLTQSVAALWKATDFDDALYTFGVGIAASMSTKTQLKIEFLDTFKNRPPAANVKKNDLATIIAVVYKL